MKEPDEETIAREQIRQREKAIRDYENDMAAASSEGEKRGLTKGIVIGKAEGIVEGRAEGKLETLSALVRDNILSLENAAKRAGMTPEEFAAKAGLS